MGYILWAIPLIGVLLFFLTNNRKTYHLISVCISTFMMGMSLILTAFVFLNGSVGNDYFGGVFYLDSLSAILLNLVVFVGLIVSIFTIEFVEEDIRQDKLKASRIKLYYMLMYIFIFTMIFTLTVKNMGLIWISIESTTLASTFLVGFYNEKTSIEAAWKYVIVCSVGIAIAMLGIVFLHISSVDVLQGKNLLDFTALTQHAKELNSSVLRLSFIFILIGFGTKAGLAPMHTWLPDAHSQSPAPISALLSGVLLNGSIYAIIRTLSIVNINLGSSLFTGRLMLAAGLLSIFVAGIVILTQKDYKRLLAYSSIEHMGIITIGIGIFTPIAIFGALFHMINHSMTKSMLFLSTGSIYQKYKTKEISHIRGLIKKMPYTGTIFLLGLFAITGTPPFSIFFSELQILISVFEKEEYLLGAGIILLLAFIFFGIVQTMFSMYREKNDVTESKLNELAEESDRPDVKDGDINKAGYISLMILATIIILIGFFMPDAIKQLITNSQMIILGGQ